MSFNAQDCEEMPSLASEHIKELEAEKEALKEKVDRLMERINWLRSKVLQEKYK